MLFSFSCRQRELNFHAGGSCHCSIKLYSNFKNINGLLKARQTDVFKG